jgi:phage terminase large subunit
LSILKIPTARVFEPLLARARYKGVHGGRGSGKSHFFGELLVETCQAERGTLAVCIREAQRTLAQSSKRLIESKIAALGVGSQFKLFNDKIETPGDGLIIFRGMQYDAGKYRLVMKARDAAAAKPVPPVQRPRHGPYAGRTRARGSANAECETFNLRRHQGRGGAL